MKITKSKLKQIIKEELKLIIMDDQWPDKQRSREDLEEKKKKLTKSQIKARDKRAKKIMKSTKEEYGKEKGEDIAYAIATKQIKKQKKSKK